MEKLLSSPGAYQVSWNVNIDLFFIVEACLCKNIIFVHQRVCITLLHVCHVEQWDIFALYNIVIALYNIMVSLPCSIVQLPTITTPSRSFVRYKSFHLETRGIVWLISQKLEHKTAWRRVHENISCRVKDIVLVFKDIIPVFSTEFLTVGRWPVNKWSVQTNFCSSPTKAGRASTY